MAERKAKSESKPSSDNAAEGTEDLQKATEEALDKGYLGENAADRGAPGNEEFSLETGPDSPNAREQYAAALAARAEARGG